MSKLSLDKNVAKQGWSIATALMIAYLWWLITTPEYSNRLAFLTTIRFERVVAVAILIAIMIGRRITARPTGMTPLVFLFFVCTILSFLLSPYGDFYRAQHWAENYWKLVVFYFFALYCFEDSEELRQAFLAFAIISFTYQLYSWLDFINGGSYVYQQGLKRIVGVWSAPGKGGPNAFGLLGVFTVPFATFLLKTETRLRVRQMAWVLLAISVATVVFTGTRGALLTLLVLVVVYFRQRLLHPKRLVIAGVIIALFVAVLPNDMKRRYFDLIFYDETKIEDRFDRSAISSAQGRFEGIEDGWKLFLKRPIIGYGPETSSIARLEVRNLRSDRGEVIYVQVHNLYAQLVSENGLLGAILFAAIVFLYLWQLSDLQKHQDDSPQFKLIRAQAQLLTYLLLTMLIYGMVSHTLYKYNWFLLFACQATLVTHARNFYPIFKSRI